MAPLDVSFAKDAFTVGGSEEAAAERSFLHELHEDKTGHYSISWLLQGQMYSYP